MLSAERGVSSQWKEADNLSEERLVLSICEAGWRCTFRKRHSSEVVSGQRQIGLAFACILVTTHVDCLFAAVNVGPY